MPPLRQPIEEMTVEHLAYIDEGAVWVENPPVMPLFTYRRAMRLASLPERIERIRADVARGQNRFRLVYGTCTAFEETQAGADCQYRNEPHFHGHVRRIGHLPMFTIKELPA